MAPTHEPRQLLEPSNLLEPLDLTEHQADLIHPAARTEKGERSQRGFTRASGGATRPMGGDRRSPVKSILMIAGALACFGSGTVFPQLQNLTRGDVEPGPTVASASRPSAPIADVVTKSDEASPVESKPPASSAGATVNTTATELEMNAADRNTVRRRSKPGEGAHQHGRQCREACGSGTARSPGGDSSGCGFRARRDASVWPPRGARAIFTPQQARGPAGDGQSAICRQTQRRNGQSLEARGGPSIELAPRQV